MRARRLCLALLLLLTSPFAAAPGRAEARGADVQVAERSIAHGQYAAALTSLAPLIKRHKPRALALAGRVHRLRGERELARQRFNEVIQLYNHDAIPDQDGEGLWA